MSGLNFIFVILFIILINHQKHFMLITFRSFRRKSIETIQHAIFDWVDVWRASSTLLNLLIINVWFISIINFLPKRNGQKAVDFYTCTHYSLTHSLAMLTLCHKSKHSNANNTKEGKNKRINKVIVL